ncbi:MAG: translational GTPase TypA [Chloroflexi bacterium]|nr:MAG: translational GTPase TypA [Chloroflexota bacterium]TMB98001.1 MAG: translational GTPase TypA [Chloroflexota bacterium]TMC30742.1 MAG: translational GTPase TypA [Chloroflexota bacterium]TMC33447.1 MAG: translational GTPase TypA [Chloroflexota bacterium]TMC58929.1 MAG: translational GTPase TypA [Chloroflexota bacterium]
MKREDIRNIAIIAHVDHGKTTLVDGMLRQSHIFRENQQVAERVMDSNALERERGITIMAKNTAVTYKGTKINIVDTPGHADFGGEVERVMNMVDGVLLLVDAVDGPMPQTKFVLRQALRRGHKAILVINKIDRPQARPNHVLNETFDLFLDLGATEEQAEYETIYTNALTGSAGTDHRHLSGSLEPLFEAILGEIPPPDVDETAPTQLLVTTTSYDDYKGRIAVGRLQSGTLRRTQPVARVDHDGNVTKARVTDLFTFQGLAREPVDLVRAGDIVAVAGVADIAIGDTIADADDPRPLPPIKVEEPTLKMSFAVNTSPFAGRDGQHVTSRKLRERLYAELERDVALRVTDTESPDTLIVSGRGELHLAILIENLRREGYELQVSRPEVIEHIVNGERHEPYEQLEIEVSKTALGAVVELAGRRRGELLDMKYRDDGSAHGVWRIPTRGLLGFRQAFLTSTRGQGVMNTLFAGYGSYAGDIESRNFGSLIAWENGTTTTFGLSQAQDRGTLFIGPGVDVYEGMVVGEHIRDRDLEVNVVRRKHLTNMRSSTSDIAVKLDGIRDLSLDDAIEFLADDELLEVTPKTYRIRKRLLTKQDRDRAIGQAKRAAGVAD